MTQRKECVVHQAGFEVRREPNEEDIELVPTYVSFPEGSAWVEV